MAQMAIETCLELFSSGKYKKSTVISCQCYGYVMSFFSTSNALKIQIL